MLALHFSPGAVNALLAAATTISMRVVDKAFQLRHLSGNVIEKKEIYWLVMPSLADLKTYEYWIEEQN